jgi:hypothetical protein
MKQTIRIACLLAVVFSMAACGPQIVSFEASPRRLYTGQSTTLSWNVKGEAVLLAEPPLAGTGAIPATGSQSFAPCEKTAFKIIAMRNGKEAVAKQDVFTFATEEEKQIVIMTQPGGDGLIAIGILPPALWDDLVRIDTISGQSHRPLWVWHEGHEVSLTDDMIASDQMHGLKVSGRWEIHAGLQPGEVMRNPDHAPPDRLSILVHLSCQK